jgi:predicted nucleic acid-binding protein
MMIVADASVVGPALIDDGPHGDHVRQRIRDQLLFVPSLIDLEVLSMVKGWTRAGLLDQRRAREAVADFLTMRLRRMPHIGLLPRIWDLRDKLSVYDAAYVALAEAIGIPLLTADRGIARTPGLACEVELIR